MDDEKLEKTIVDNTRLEELLTREKTPEMQNEFLETLKNSRLFLPVFFRKIRQENEMMEDAFKLKGQFGFDMDYMPDGKGKKILLLYTSLESMKESKIKLKPAILISMGNLAEMLKQTDEYSEIGINLFKRQSLRIPTEKFLSQFGIVGNHKIKDIRNEELKELLNEKDLSDEKFKECLLSSTMLVPYIDEYDGETSLVLIFDDYDKQYLQVYTDLDEYEKGLKDDLEEIYPQAYRLSELLKFAEEYVVINKATERFVFRAEILKKRETL